MDAMVLKLEPVAQTSFEQYGPWHLYDRRYSVQDGMDLGEALLQTSTAMPALKKNVLNDGLKTWAFNTQVTVKPIQDPNEGSPSPPPPSESGSCGLDSLSAPQQPKSGSTWLLSQTLGSTPAFRFKQVVSTVQQVFSFPLDRQRQLPRQSVKRRRPTSDVDGPYTASLGCKKRRLRRDLVTSRLSRPFSVPATHIISRESLASGDKRFLKLAAIVSARRMSGAASTPVNQHNHPSPSSLLRRAAVINRFRLRVQSQAEERGDDEVADLAANAALLQQSHGVGLVVGARFPVASPSSTVVAAPGTPALRVPYPGGSQSLSPAAAGPTSPRLRAADSTTSPGLRLPPSPRMRPIRSPELRSTRPPFNAALEAEEGLDDDEVAFPTSEHESRYEVSDESDDVYADFGVIFGGGSADGESSDDEGEHYEDYMDDMDGIPWTAR